jgi:hypothetical protein
MAYPPTITDIKTRLTGDSPLMSGNYDGVLTAKLVEVRQALERDVAQARGIRGPWTFLADSTASARRFTGKPGGSRYLPIDDCVEVSSVTQGGVALVVDVDYVVDPLQGTPIVGLLLLNGVWSTKPADISVAAKWGFAATVGTDVIEVICIEVIRSHLADEGGADDRVGIVTAFGTVMVSKTFTGKRAALVSSYSFGGGPLR